VLCPLRFEQRALERAGVGRIADLACVGPGAPGMDQRLDRIVLPNHDPLILAGLAGGLNPAIRAGAACVISRVIALGDATMTPDLAGGTIPSAVVACSVEPLTNPQQRRTLRQETGADLVDMESLAFARFCQRRRIRWSIVRGVSDDAGTTLPPGIGRWVDGRGRTRSGAVIGDLLLHPRHWRLMMRLGRDGRLAMRAVADILLQMLAESSR
jgi:hypothetical protein